MNGDDLTTLSTLFMMYVRTHNEANKLIMKFDFFSMYLFFVKLMEQI